MTETILSVYYWFPDENRASDSLNGALSPSTAVEVSMKPEDWISLINGANSDPTKQIGYENGTLQLVPFTHTAAELWAAYKVQAQALLDKSDLVATRCFKAGIAFPAAWQSYVITLRAILSSAIGDSTQPLPSQPSYPQGS